MSKWSTGLPPCYLLSFLSCHFCLFAALVHVCLARYVPSQLPPGSVSSIRTTCAFLASCHSSCKGTQACFPPSRARESACIYSHGEPELVRVLPHAYVPIRQPGPCPLFIWSLFSQVLSTGIKSVTGIDPVQCLRSVKWSALCLWIPRAPSVKALRLVSEVYNCEPY